MGLDEAPNEPQKCGLDDMGELRSLKLTAQVPDARVLAN